MESIIAGADTSARRSLTALLSWLRDKALVPIALIGLAAGGLAYWTDNPYLAGLAWTVATLPVLAALIAEIVAALRHADVGLDVIAALSMTAALTFGEPLAANVVALMYAGGQLLETYAEGRAKREMTALLSHVARTAMRRRGAGLEDVPIDAVEPGDTLLIRQGEVLPVNGKIAPANSAILDLSALTGEPLPQAVEAGAEVLSGSTSLGAPFDLVASRPAKDSAYAGIVRLVEAAQRSKSPTMRLADRYSVGFLAITVFLAAIAWIASGDPGRAIAVLVVATPCPLILAVPIAFISGMSRTANSGLLVKSAGVFETLARIRVAILDKTGTLTHGSAEISRIATADGFTPDDVLRCAASLDQASGHVLAATLVRAAALRGLPLTSPTDVRETPGAGIEGMVGGRRVAVGGDGYVRARIDGDDPSRLHPASRGALAIAVGVDGRLAGVIELEDRIRDDARAVIDRLRSIGVSRVVLASGDRVEVAQAVGEAMGADVILSSVTPAQKVEAVRAARQYGPTMMVGDGVNDAPALAAADVGVAMGARGAAASSETAGAVLLVDALAPLAFGLEQARRSRKIALQSVWVGLSLSGLAMVAAALGFLPPIAGALLQEAIDVAVILNALRALR